MDSIEEIIRARQRAEEMSLQSSLDELENSVQGMLKRDCIEYYNYYKRNLRDFRRLIREQENEDEMTAENDAPGGYCVIWSCWYAELRLSNCDKNRKCIVKLALKNIKNNNITLTQYIRNYSVEILKKLN